MVQKSYCLLTKRILQEQKECYSVKTFVFPENLSYVLEVLFVFLSCPKDGD